MNFTLTNSLAATGLALAIVNSAASPVHSVETVPSRHWQVAASPSDMQWSPDKLQIAKQFSETLDTAATMIVQQGVVVDQWGSTALPLNCHSIRKSILSALYGSHVEAGSVDLDSTLKQLGINDNEPSLTPVERQATLRHLLKARSGVYHSALYETATMASARPPRGSHEPDKFWYYNNWDFNASGKIFENLTGRSLFEEFEDRLAGPLEMEDFHRSRHTRYVTGEDSVYPAYPIELSTRDLARFGLLMLRNGRWNGEQILSEEWIRESTTSYSDAGAAGGYGYMWWVADGGKHFPGVTLPDGSYSARGSRGQYLVVIPEWDLVICHRVNSFQKDRSVAKTDFGKLLSLILSARATSQDAVKASPASGASTALPTLDMEAYDVLIRHGEVIDGSGNQRFLADVGIRDGVIVEIGALHHASAHRTINATGQLVVPGFIDMHSHAEVGLISSDPARRCAPNLVTQGITTVVVNQDGGATLRAFSMSEDDVEVFLKTPWTATSSDAGITLPSDGLVHSRFYGAFPRKIRKYAEGIQWVLINGKVAVEAEQSNGSLSGRVLTRLDTQISNDASLHSLSNKAN